MKIALIVPGGVDRSGKRRVIPVLLWLIERLASRHQVCVFALGQEGEPGEWRLFGATVRDSGRSRLSHLRLVKAVWAEHARDPFDVIHAFAAVGPGVCASVLRLLTGIPVVLTLPGGELTGIPDIGYGARISWRSRAWVRLALAGASRVVVPSNCMAAHAIMLGHHVEKIEFGVALDRWPALRPRKRREGDPLRLIHVATLNRVKDQPTLLAAMARLREHGIPCSLDVVGLDTLGGKIQSLCSALNLDDLVHFLGPLTQDELVPLVAGADILVMSSRHEGAAIVVLEAAALGVPTVGTDVGVISDWHPDSAVAVQVRDSGALADAIARLARDEGERMRLAQAAQDKARAHDADAFVQAMECIYADLAATASPATEN